MRAIGIASRSTTSNCCADSKSDTCLWQLWRNCGEGHGGSLAGSAVPVAPVPNLVGGQEVAGPVVTPPLEWLETLILKYLLLDRPCSYIAAIHVHTQVFQGKMAGV